MSSNLNNNVTITVDASEAIELVQHLIECDRFVEAQWVDGLDSKGREYGKYVTEDVVGFWSDDFRFADDTDPTHQDKSTILLWITSNLPKTGDVRIVHV